MDAGVFTTAAGVSPVVIANFILWLIAPIVCVIAILGIASGMTSALLTGSPTRLAIIVFVVLVFVAIITAILA